MRIEWNDKEVMKKAQVAADRVSREGAGWVLSDARRLLAAKAKNETARLAKKRARLISRAAKKAAKAKAKAAK